MAEKNIKQTVRARSQSGAPVSKKRRLKTSAKKATSPVKIAGRRVAKAAQPLSPVLVPFKTRPMRFIGRILAKVFLINYFVSSYNELRDVEWPNFSETVRLTVAVFVFSIIFGLLVSASDFGLDKLFHKILLR